MQWTCTSKVKHPVAWSAMWSLNPYGAWQICRHKAAPVAEGSGCVKMFECMYHGWQYGENIQLPASLPWQYVFRGAF